MAVGQENPAPVTRPPAAATGSPTAEQLVCTTGLLLVLIQLGFRAWALFPSWFYTDDYRFLSQARADGLSPGYLVSPFDSQFMPVGRLLAWAVDASGTAPWGVAASVTLTLQAVASFACLWMLVTLFGARWSVVALLSLYLFSAMTLPALMWWSASLNALPLQITLFLGVTCWVRHLRGDGRRWWAATVLVLALGLLSYVKAVLVLAVLAYLLLAYFSSGSVTSRVTSAVRRHWRSAAVIGTLGAAYGVYYLTQVPSIASGEGGPVALGLLRSMVGRSWASGLLGGPWRWDESNPPVGYADPPGWTLLLAWALIAGLVVLLARARRRTGRAWVLLGLYTGAAYLLLLTTRAAVVGAAIGTEYRYLTDVQPVAVLCLGLALLPLRGAKESSQPRDRAPGTGPLQQRIAAGLVVAVSVSGVVSSVAYVRIWHQDNPGERWTRAAIQGLGVLDGRGPTPVADEVVPTSVVPGFSYPFNTTKRLLPVLVEDVVFPDVAEDLVVLDRDGAPRRAVIDPLVASEPGTQEGCGRRIEGPGATAVPMTGTLFDSTWWMRIGYLASVDDEVTVDLGDRRVTIPVTRGLHNVFVRVDTGVDDVTLGGLAPGSTMCVDTVEIGNVVPGGPL